MKIWQVSFEAKKQQLVFMLNFSIDLSIYWSYWKSIHNWNIYVFWTFIHCIPLKQLSPSRWRCVFRVWRPPYIFLIYKSCSLFCFNKQLHMLCVILSNTFRFENQRLFVTSILSTLNVHIGNKCENAKVEIVHFIMKMFISCCCCFIFLSIWPSFTRFAAHHPCIPIFIHTCLYAYSVYLLICLTA